MNKLAILLGISFCVQGVLQLETRLHPFGGASASCGIPPRAAVVRYASARATDFTAGLS